MGFSLKFSFLCDLILCDFFLCIFSVKIFIFLLFSVFNNVVFEENAKE